MTILCHFSYFNVQYLGHINLSLAFKRMAFYHTHGAIDPREPTAGVGEAVLWALGSGSRAMLCRK